jgi:hypothetical protein
VQQVARVRLGSQDGLELLAGLDPRVLRVRRAQPALQVRPASQDRLDLPGLRVRPASLVQQEHRERPVELARRVPLAPMA